MTVRQHQTALRNAAAGPSTANQFDLGWHSRTPSVDAARKPKASRDLVYTWERFPAIMREIVPLLHRHYRETAAHRNVKLDVNFEQYCQLDEAGVLHVLTARYNGVLVGYLFSTVGAHLNFVTTVFSTAHMCYLLPEHRRGWNGVWLLREWIKAANSSGVRVLQIAETLRVRGKRGKRVAVLLAYLGFKRNSQEYTKLIGG